MKPYIITIARQYGSGGKTVGKMLAERLGIPFYNREIITMASEDSGVNAMLFSDERLKSDFIARLHARYRGDIPVPNDSSKSYLRDEALFSYQVKIIERLKAVKFFKCLKKFPMGAFQVSSKIPIACF